MATAEVERLDPAPRLRRGVLAVLAVALLVRLVFLAATGGYEPRHDDRHYDRLACAISQGAYPYYPPKTTKTSCGPLDPRDAATAFRPPLWPAVLAGVDAVAAPLTDNRRTPGRIFNALLGTLSVGLMGLIALQLWGRRTVLPVMLATALSPPLVLLIGSLHSEPLFLALVLGALAVVLHARTWPRRTALWVAGAGVLLGLAALTRPNALLLALPLGVALAARGRPWLQRLALPTLLVVVAGLTIAPWTLRNARELDAFIPISDHLGSWLGGTYNDESRANRRHPGAMELRVEAFSDLDGVDEVPRQRELTKRGIEYALDHPGYVVTVLVHNTRRLLNLEGADWWRAQGESVSLPGWPADFAAVGFFLIAPLAIAGAFTAAARRARWWLWAVPVLLFVSVIPAGSEVRYRSPVDPFLAALAALALLAAADRLRARRAAPPRAPDDGTGSPAPESVSAARSGPP